MSLGVVEELISYVGFEPKDAQILARLAPFVRPRAQRVVDRFYWEIQHHPDARAALGGAAQQERLRVALRAWLDSLFCGCYDAEYWAKRRAIGHAHVRVGVRQHYMFGAIEVIRQELIAILLESDEPDLASAVGALNKLLALETAVMLDSYRDSWAERERQSERQLVAERLSRAEHLAEIGRLSASLAHEIKNPLAGISGAISVIRDGLPAADSRIDVLNEVLRQIRRLDDTVRDLLSFARPVPPRTEVMLLSELWARLCVSIAREPLLHALRIESGGAEGLPPLRADANQLEQLLLNLILNAAQASVAGGRVVVRFAATGGVMRIEVQDFGAGMSLETQTRAFEPFFTTKARGTGLGLPICRRIVEAHGGTITIRSRAGAGTLVRVDLPLNPPALDAAKPPEMNPG